MAGPIDARAIALLDDGRRRYSPVKPLLRSHLARPFPQGDHKRILLVHMDDPIAWPQFYPFYHDAALFADLGYVFRTVPYPAQGAERLIKEASAIFLQSPYVLGDGEIERVLERLKSANPRVPVSYFDWFAPTDVRFADRVGDYVDFYTKKALLRDRDYYRADHAAHTSLEEYYSASFGLVPDHPTWSCRPDIVERLVLAPGFATAPKLLNAFGRRTAVPSGARTIDVHARFDTAPRQLHAAGRVNAGARTHWYVAMREQAMEMVEGLPSRYNIARQGRVGRQEFLAELERSQLCFSPFGFGELCWRDLEAMLTGAVLIKPDMSHLECFCDIYRPGETYIPVRWDLADLADTVAALLERPAECRAIAARAFNSVKGYLAGPKTENLLRHLTETSSVV